MQCLNVTHARCGYPLDTEEFSARFAVGLDERIRLFVRRFRRQNRGADLLELVESALVEEQELRAREPKRAGFDRRRKPTNLVNCLDNEGDPIFFASGKLSKRLKQYCAILSTHLQFMS